VSSETSVLIAVDQDGYLVDYIGESGRNDAGIIRVRDNVGDAEATVPLTGVLPIVGTIRESAPVLDIAPNLLRLATGAVGGTIWVQTYEDATSSDDPDVRVTTVFIEVDLDGNEVSRISSVRSAAVGATLTATNR
jgi:hypothetical protein